MTTPTPEAIEATARALYELEYGEPWSVNSVNTKGRYRAEATAALTAAAPFIAAHALRAAAAEYDAITNSENRLTMPTGDWFRARAATIEGKDS